jgi:hypothetical protein
VADDPSPQYIRAGAGALATEAGIRWQHVRRMIFSMGTYKDVNITERMRFRNGTQFGNLFNHPQYIPGSKPGQGLWVNDVNSFNTTTQSYLSFLTPGNANFNNPKSVFASNARSIAIVAKFTF